MGLKPFRGVCVECQHDATLYSRNLCWTCKSDPAIRAKHPPIQNRRSIDLVGMPPFGKLTVIAPAGTAEIGDTALHKVRMWLCRCECGKEVVRSTGALRTGNTKSCGCWKSEATSATFKKHGASGTPEYTAWCLIKYRCHDERSPDYANYGGRGIVVAPEWRDSFERFIADVGPRPAKGMSLDRIDVNRGYEPGNVQWLSQKGQCRNKRTNRMITHNGETLPVSEWAERIGVDPRLVWKRLNRGISIDKVLSPKDGRRSSGAGAFLSSEKGIYYAMIRRCTKVDDENYPDYGGRGIGISDRWLGPDGFTHFITDMGQKPPKHSIERRENDKDYGPDNCFWAPSKSQARNTRKNRLLTFNGETMCIAAWGEKLGIPAWKISQRLGRGYPIEKVLHVGAIEKTFVKPGRTRFITHNGVTKSAKEWAADAGVSTPTFLARIDRGKTMDEALGK